MFNKLRDAFSNLIRTLTEKELSEGELNKVLRLFELQLISNDVAVEVAKEISSSIKKQLLGVKVKRFSNIRDYVEQILREEIRKILEPKEAIDLITKVKKRREKNLESLTKNGGWVPYVILFLGPNGSGKTVTIAKIAWLMKRNNLTPVLVASDTFRAGAIEQLEKHAKAIGATIIKRPYGSDPASVAFDAITHAKAKKKDVVLIDTAGRLGTNVDLMEEMRKISRVSKPDLKIFIADALAGNDLVVQAREFNEYVGIDGNILTKIDADVKGGAALTVAYITKAPILYVGVGQRYSDLLPFNVNWFLKNILGGR